MTILLDLLQQSLFVEGFAGKKADTPMAFDLFADMDASDGVSDGVSDDIADLDFLLPTVYQAAQEAALPDITYKQADTAVIENQRLLAGFAVDTAPNQNLNQNLDLDLDLDLKLNPSLALFEWQNVEVQTVSPNDAAQLVNPPSKLVTSEPSIFTPVVLPDLLPSLLPAVVQEAPPSVLKEPPVPFLPQAQTPAILTSSSYVGIDLSGTQTVSQKLVLWSSVANGQLSQAWHQNNGAHQVATVERINKVIIDVGQLPGVQHRVGVTTVLATQVQMPMFNNQNPTTALWVSEQARPPLPAKTTQPTVAEPTVLWPSLIMPHKMTWDSQRQKLWVRDYFMSAQQSNKLLDQLQTHFGSGSGSSGGLSAVVINGQRVL